MIQALATQMALDKLGFENETIDITGFNKEIKKANFAFIRYARKTVSPTNSRLDTLFKLAGVDDRIIKGN